METKNIEEELYCEKCESSKDMLPDEGLCTWCFDDEVKGRNNE